jgi:hypothetical protein
VSGIMIPPFVFSSAGAGLTTTRSLIGLIIDLLLLLWLLEKNVFSLI